MKTRRVLVVLLLGWGVYADGMLIERAPHEGDAVTPALYLSHPSYARTVLRGSTNVLDLHAFASTGDGLFSFDTDGISRSTT